jgi:hypothetical protein
MFKAFFFLFMLVVLISVSTVLFVGAGYFVSLIFALTLFQATALCIGASFVLAFIIFALMLDKLIFRVVHLNRKTTRIFNMDEEENENDEEEVFVNEQRVGRNASCPCGSGKKYKFCCGKYKSSEK